MNLTSPNDVLERIYASNYYTNHGPMARQLEESLQDFFAVKNAVIVSNESLALIIALAGLGLTGRVGVSIPCPDFAVSAVVWAGLEPVPTGEAAAADDLVAVLVCNRPGTPAPHPLLHLASSRNRQAVVYQHGYLDRNIERDYTATVVTLGETMGALSAQCSVILTSNDALAEKYRNIRGSYGLRETVDVRATANGRVSEFQAGMALLFLQNLRHHQR